MRSDQEQGRRIRVGGIFLVLLLLSGCTKTESGGQAGSGKLSPADEYPSKTVTLVCPWSAGGGTDRLSRYIADELDKQFDESVVVQNRTGGGGAVGHTAGARAKPDGHTLLMATFELSTMHWMGISDLSWKDYTWLAQLNADAAAIIVRKDSPWKDVKAFVDHIKNSSQKVKMSGTATGGAWDLARAGMMQAAGLAVDSVIWSPTKGSAPALVELLGGHIDAVCCSVPEAAPQIEAGELRVLAVMSDERLADYPEYPTCRESGIEWTAVGWRGLAAPKDTDAAIVQKLRGSIDLIVKSPEFESFMKKNGFNVTIRNSEEFATFLQAQDEQWKSVIAAAGYAK